MRTKLDTTNHNKFYSVFIIFYLFLIIFIFVSIRSTGLGKIHALFMKFLNVNFDIHDLEGPENITTLRIKVVCARMCVCERVNVRVCFGLLCWGYTSLSNVSVVCSCFLHAFYKGVFVICCCVLCIVNIHVHHHRFK